MDTLTINEPQVAEIVFDEKGDPIGISFEEWMNKLDNRLIEHFGDDFRTRVNESRERWNKTGRWHFDIMKP